MEIEEMEAVIRQFQLAHSAVFLTPNVHGVHIALRDDKTLVLQIRVLSKPAIAHLAEDEKISSSFSYHFLNDSKSLPVEYIVRNMASASVKCGEQVQLNPNAPAYGTVGWNYFSFSNDYQWALAIIV